VFSWFLTDGFWRKETTETHTPSRPLMVYHANTKCMTKNSFVQKMMKLMPTLHIAL